MDSYIIGPKGDHNTIVLLSRQVFTHVLMTYLMRAYPCASRWSYTHVLATLGRIYGF